MGAEGGGYHMFSIGGRSVAGMGPAFGEDAMPLWGTYINVDDLDAALERAVAAGGNVLMERIDILRAGSMATVRDPSGASVSFWQAGDHIGCELANEANTLGWNELTTRDPEAAKPFYAAVLGWTYETVDMGTGDYILAQVDGRTVAAIMPMLGDEWGELPSHWMAYIAVDDVDAIMERTTELGGTVSLPATDIPPGRFGIINDPAGAAVSVITFSELEDPNNWDS
ncbi:MAG: putative enzyme related to lactoylglutathione lyase [Candidatus Poriferisodalaceae bacterium]|jgi:predicted enzyme related to lactoylglutathione lyase